MRISCQLQIRQRNEKNDDLGGPVVYKLGTIRGGPGFDLDNEHFKIGPDMGVLGSDRINFITLVLIVQGFL